MALARIRLHIARAAEERPSPPRPADLFLITSSKDTSLAPPCLAMLSINGGRDAGQPAQPMALRLLT